ncbi:MAG TPA: pitrilysin family protein [Gemmatimonadales bacterium]|nr:pitrilysin family protein [Gemmatimonadales bacterium]
MHTVTLLIGLGLVSFPLAAQKEAPPAPGPPRAYRVPPHRTFTLPDGMRVTLVQYGLVPKVTVSLALATGGIDEAADETQLAELTANLLVEGTETRSGAEISRQAADMGGGLTSGASDDNVTIGGEVLSENAVRYVQLVGDVARHPRFAQADVERLRANMIRDNSIALSQPDQICREKFRQLIFGDHPYARIYASEAMLQGYSAEKVRAFYQKNFGARRAHLYVSGVFDAKAVEQAVRQAFQGWPSGPPATSRPPVPVTQRQVSLVDRPGAVQSALRVGLPVADPSSADWIRLSVTDALLGGAFGSRITANIREDKGYTYSPFSLVMTWPHTGIWAELADVTTNVTGPSLKEIFHEVSRLRKEAPSAAELAGIENNMVGLFTLRNSSRYGLINQLQFVDQHGLGENYLTDYVRNAMGVTPAQVQQTAERYLDPDRMSIMVVGDKQVVDPQLAPFKGGTP